MLAGVPGGSPSPDPDVQSHLLPEGVCAEGKVILSQMRKLRLRQAYRLAEGLLFSSRSVCLTLEIPWTVVCQGFSGLGISQAKIVGCQPRDQLINPGLLHWWEDFFFFLTTEPPGKLC